MITIVDDLFDLNLNQALRTLELLVGADRLGFGPYSYLWRSDVPLPKTYCTTVRTTLSHLHVLYTVHLYILHTVHITCFPASQFPMFDRC